MFSMAMWMAALVAPIQIFAGDQHGLNTLEYQPAKIAAMEGHYDTHAGAPLILFGIPDMDAETTRYAIEYPEARQLDPHPRLERHREAQGLAARSAPERGHHLLDLPHHGRHRLVAGLAGGRHTFEVRAVDDAGNVDPTPSTYSWTVVDQTAPETSITSGPAATTQATTAIFEFEADEAATLQCSLDGAPFAACTSPFQVTGVGVGPHDFRVVATDSAGNVDTTPASYPWTVAAPPDTTPPQTTIDTGPPADTASTSATLTFSSSELGSTFDCSLDGGAFTSCTSPHQLTGLSVGVHQLRVRAIDPSGNRDLSPAALQLACHPAAGDHHRHRAGRGDREHDGHLHLRGRPARRHLRVRPRPGHRVRALRLGDHLHRPGLRRALVLRAGSGSAGNVEATPAEHSWIIGDLTPPVVTITAQPLIATEDTTPTFEFEADDAAAVFQCSLDGSPFVVCDSGRTYTEAEVAAGNGSVAGEHTFEVQGLTHHLLVDPVPAVYTWTIEDHTAPDTTILAAPPGRGRLRCRAARPVRLRERRARCLVRVRARPRRHARVQQLRFAA